MQCEEVRNQFADYVIDQVGEPARSLIERHLATCPACKAEAADMTDLWSALRAIPSTEAPADLRARFDLMLEAYKHGLDNSPTRGWWRALNARVGRLWPQQPVLQLAVSMALLLIGVVVGRQLYTVPAPAATTSQPTTEVTELRSEVSQMRQMVALSLMQQQSASDRLMGVNWSYRLKQPNAEVLTALLSTLMHDPNVNVRLATVDALRQFGDQSVVRRGVVDALGRQESPLVQIALIDLAVDLHEKESTAVLQQLAGDQKLDGAVRQHAQQGLAALQ